jgi:hypothetical protein
LEITEAGMNAEAVSISTFCRENAISPATFYNLRKRGKAPRTLLVGRRRLVSREAAAEWRRAMEDPTDAAPVSDGKPQ